MASLASESGENTPRSGSGENVEETSEPTQEGVTRDKAVQPNNSEDGHSNPVEAPNYIARKNAAMAENFDHFDENYVIAVTGNTVVFSPRAAGEAPDMDMLLNYMMPLKLDQVVEKSYNLVYCHTGMNWFSRKHFAWLKEAYSILGRKFKKNISKQLSCTRVSLSMLLSCSLDLSFLEVLEKAASCVVNNNGRCYIGLQRATQSITNCVQIRRS